MPRYVTRGAWRARPAEDSTPLPGPFQGLAVHWQGPGLGKFRHMRCPELVRGIQGYHMDKRNYDDIAYNWLACPHGYIFVARGRYARSAANGTDYSNDRYLAVCYLGGVGDPFTDEAKRAILELKADIKAPSLKSHRDFKRTECPGDVIHTWVQSNPRLEPEPVPPPPYDPEDPEMQIYIVKDPNSDRQYLTNGITKYWIPNPTALGEYLKVFPGIKRISLTTSAFKAIPTLPGDA